MEGYDLKYGDRFTVDNNEEVYVYLGDEYDEDTMWTLEVSTGAPFAMSKCEEVELVTKVEGIWQRTSE